MHTKLRQQAVQLRKKKELSYSEIQRRLGVSKSTLSYWLREFPLSKEKIYELRLKGWKRGESSREQFRETMRQKREVKEREIYQKYAKRFAKLSKDAFFLGGLMLYVAEGNKRDRNKIALANTDYRVILFFMKWLSEFFYTFKKDMRIELHLYDDMNIEQEKMFWKKKLRVKDNQFYKTQIRAVKKNSFTYLESYRHGTCSVIINSASKKQELTAAIQALLDKNIFV